MKMNFRNNFYLTGFVSLFALLTIFSCSTSLPVAESYRQDNLEPAANLNEDFFTIGDSLSFVKVSHNDTHIQVQLKATEPSSILRFLMMGVTIWIDSTASQQKNLGVVFPGSGVIIPRQLPAEGRELNEDDDQDQPFEFDPSPFLDIVKKRNMVLRYGEKAEFIQNDIASMYVDENKNLNYVVTFPFSRLNISDPSNTTINVGILSDAPVVVADSQQQRSTGTATRPYPYRGPSRPVQPVEPVEAWIIINLDQTPAQTP